MSFLDLLSNGVGASILLLLIFTISRGLAPTVEAGGASVLRARFVMRDLTSSGTSGSRPIVTVLVSRNTGPDISLPLEVLDLEQLVLPKQWSRYAPAELATSIGIASYAADREHSKRDYDIVVENPGTDCWSFSVRFVDRERLRGYEIDDQGIEVIWLEGGAPSGTQVLRPGERSNPYGLHLEQQTQTLRVGQCSGKPLQATGG
jgi:hypothetical protein